jgi:hypothetical protein
MLLGNKNAENFLHDIQNWQSRGKINIEIFQEFPSNEQHFS